MASVETKLTRRRIAGAYLSSVFSISLVLLLVGVASLLVVGSRNASDYFKENMKLEVVFALDATQQQVMDYGEALAQKPGTKSVEFISKEQGMQEMTSTLGEDFLAVFDTPPIPFSLDVSLNAAYVSDAQVDSLVAEIRRTPLVEDVVYQKSLVDSVNKNLHRISVTLMVIIILLVFISYVLIGNTVRLNLHNKRFSVHTMRLVGATKSFIRRPFMFRSVVQGVIASLLSMIFLLGVLLVVKRQFAQILVMMPQSQLYAILGVMLCTGVLICSAATFITVSRMVTLRKDELYI